MQGACVIRLQNASPQHPSRYACLRLGQERMKGLRGSCCGDGGFATPRHGHWLMARSALSYITTRYWQSDFRSHPTSPTALSFRVSAAASPRYLQRGRSQIEFDSGRSLCPYGVAVWQSCQRIMGQWLGGIKWQTLHTTEFLSH